MLLKHTPPENARKQLEELKQKAELKDKQGWVTISTTDWPIISWLSLINALEAYLKDYNGDVWRQQVGGAQLILPAHVINEYSHPSRPFYPCPKWGTGESALVRTGVSDWIVQQQYNLGKDFAWCRGEWAARDWLDGYRNINYDYVRYDLAAVNELLKSRMEQAQLLLESELTSRPHSSSRPKMG